MPLEKSYKIAIIVIISLLVISATVLRFIPADQGSPMNAISASSRPAALLELSGESISQALNSSTLFVLDFYYPGCGPCRFLNNTTSELSEELGGQVQFGRMNAKNKENSRAVKDYKISSYPTLLIFNDGVLISRMKGNISKSDLLAELQNIEPALNCDRVKLPPADLEADLEAEAETEAERGAERGAEREAEREGGGEESKAPTKPAEKSITKPGALEPAGEKAPGKAIPLIKPGSKNPHQAMLITDESIGAAISQYQPVMAVVAFRETCAFCRQINVTIEELARELQSQVAFGLIDTRANPETKARYNITSVPTMLIFKDGELAGKVVGAKKKEVVLAQLKKIQPGLNTSKVVLPPPPPKPTPQQVCANMSKSEQPLLQAFVVSRCPFGLQMQRIMADIIMESGETDRYLKVRYIGSVDEKNNTIRAMHGEVEAQENLLQICIREEQPERYWDYLRCYMKEGKTAECLTSAQIDVDELNACTNTSSRGLAYAREDFELAGEFKITGSPTMLMNNEIVKESNFATNTTNARSPQAVKELLCCGFIKEPSFCSMRLNESRSATMFSKE
ncbi:MAG: thioredoxin domain-containing protein [Methanothrix sp.]|jgi:thioredoxin 1|uniref:thioredoxin domain-containing protein n=3 Tax=Methanothrix sp. TaxID=90426 RepID=UPI001BD4047E